MSTEEYENFYFNACLLDYKKMGEAMKNLVNLMDKTDKVKINGPGNVRTPEVTINKGNLNIDAVNDKIYFELEDSRVIYSEPGEKINVGNIEVLTELSGADNKRANIMLTLDYSKKDIDLQYDNTETTKIFYPASVPYKISIENEGGIPTIINIK